MAVDSAAKRRSASQTITGLSGPGVTPTASPDQAWRQAAGWGYYGILAGLPAEVGAVRMVIAGQPAQNVVIIGEPARNVIIEGQPAANVTIKGSV